MQPPLPSFTTTWHNDTYPAISPERPELSMAGKTVIITGAGSGIGRETAVAFALAGASRIVLLGRTRASLEETAALIPNNVPAVVHAVDVCDVEAVKTVATSVGVWDVLVLAAGYVSQPSFIATADLGDWWQSFETNVKGTVVCAQAFLPTKNESKVAIFGITSGPATALPPSMLPASSAYASSKLALSKIMENLAAEDPNVFALSVHPGLIETAVFTKSGAQADSLPMDKVQLPAHFLVWLASPEASFLKGRLVFANWDVTELKAQEKAILDSSVMTVGVNGWPFQPTDT